MIARESGYSPAPVKYALRELEFQDHLIYEIRHFGKAKHGGRNFSVQYWLNLEKLVQLLERQRALKAAEPEDLLGKPAETQPFLKPAEFGNPLSMGENLLRLSPHPAESGEKPAESQRRTDKEPTSEEAKERESGKPLSPANPSGQENQSQESRQLTQKVITLAKKANPQAAFSAKAKREVRQAIAEIGATEEELEAIIPDRITRMDEFQLVNAGSTLGAELVSLVEVHRTRLIKAAAAAERSARKQLEDTAEDEYRNQLRQQSPATVRQWFASNPPPQLGYDPLWEQEVVEAERAELHLESDFVA